MSDRNVLHLYDFMLAKGGAEAVSIELLSHFENMDFTTGFINEVIFDSNSFPREVNILIGAISNPAIQCLALSNLFSRYKVSSDSYDKLLFSGSYATLAFQNFNQEGKILYCHTPPRFVYDLKKHYLSTIPMWQRFLLKGLIYYFQPRYETAIEGMDLIIANSVNVQGRIKKYLGKESIVIHPPCNNTRFKWLGLGDYYLSTARLEPYKRVDHIVKAFMDMPDKKLIVASGGSQLEYLKKLAQGYRNIQFTGWCTEEQLSNLVGNAIATLYLPIDEDFGMSPVESMAAGKPVIGVNEGGVKETVVHKETGILIEADNIEQGIAEAVNELNAKTAMQLRESCEERAKLFDRSIFFSKIEQVLETPNNKLSQLITDSFFNI